MVPLWLHGKYYSCYSTSFNSAVVKRTWEWYRSCYDVCCSSSDCTVVQFWFYGTVVMFKLFGGPVLVPAVQRTSSDCTILVVYMYTVPVLATRWSYSGLVVLSSSGLYRGLVPAVPWSTSNCLMVQFRLYGGLCGCMISPWLTFMTGLHLGKKHFQVGLELSCYEGMKLQHRMHSPLQHCFIKDFTMPVFASLVLS